MFPLQNLARKVLTRHQQVWKSLASTRDNDLSQQPTNYWLQPGRQRYLAFFKNIQQANTIFGEGTTALNVSSMIKQSAKWPVSVIWANIIVYIMWPHGQKFS